MLIAFAEGRTEAVNAHKIRIPGFEWLDTRCHWEVDDGGKTQPRFRISEFSTGRLITPVGYSSLAYARRIAKSRLEDAGTAAVRAMILEHPKLNQ